MWTCCTSHRPNRAVRQENGRTWTHGASEVASCARYALVVGRGRHNDWNDESSTDDRLPQKPCREDSRGSSTCAPLPARASVHLGLSARSCEQRSLCRNTPVFTRPVEHTKQRLA